MGSADVVLGCLPPLMGSAGWTPVFVARALCLLTVHAPPKDLIAALSPLQNSDWPLPRPHPQAAVALIMRAPKNPGPAADTDRANPILGADILFIQRATNERDPWSGQMALPGGRHEPTDAELWDTAERETHEEIGLQLSPDHRIGALSRLEGGNATKRPISVAPFVYWVDDDPVELRPNYEVADTLWVPVPELVNPERFISYHYAPVGSSFPGIRLDGRGQVIWGLTLRMLADLFSRLGLKFMEL